MLVEAKRTNHWFFLYWLLTTCWLFVSAFLTYGEYGDGYTTINNGRFLFGDTPGHNAQRGPLAALALWPVEMFIDWANWNLVDIRPYHFYSGLLHSLYILGCWIIIKRSVPYHTRHAGIAPLLALMAAIPSVVFYAFAPYLSHDIIPGLLFLVLIYFCHRWLNKPTIETALWLVLIGSAVTFIKQTYAIFWVVLIGYALIAYIGRLDNRRVTGRKLSMLFALALTSGVISWIGYGIWMAKNLQNDLLIVRPWLMISAIHDRYGVNFPDIFSQDLYLRNIHNYGISAAVLVIPGLLAAVYSRDARLRMVSICWLLSVTIMQLITFKEVRYLAFLAPLTAVLILPIIQHILKQRVLTLFLVVLLLVDQSRGWSLAAKQLSTTAAIDVTRFLDAPTNRGTAIVSRILTFIYMADSPLERDLYHGIYHLSALQFHLLHETKIAVVFLDNPQHLGNISIKPGERVYWANTQTLRDRPWAANHNKPARSDKLLLVAGDVASVQLVRRGERYAIKGNDNHPVMFVPEKSSKQQTPIITKSGLTLAQVQMLYDDIQDRERFSVVAVIVKGLCQSEQCAYYE